MDERNLVAISIKHTEYRWKFGMPCVLWGHRTKDDEKRSFGGYTIYPNNAEIYSLKEWQESEYGAGDVCKVDTPVHMEINFCKKWKKYDTVLVPIDEYIGYCKCACLALDKPGMEVLTMAEYIEREDALKVLKIARGYCPFAYEEIKNIPAADVVEVVRCKDCKYSRPMDDIEKMEYYESVIICESFEMNDCATAVYPDDFCSYGEREED